MADLPEPPPTILQFNRRGHEAISYGATPLDCDRIARDIAALDTFTQGLDRSSSAAAPLQ